MESIGTTERNKEALRSETWREAREATRKEIPRFTETPEVKNLDAMKVSESDNVYGVRWGNLVRDYLKTAYSGDEAEAEIVSWDVAYKVLRREEVTVFYDADGDTLFDVENRRLAKEFEWLMKEDVEPGHADIDTKGKSESESTDKTKTKTMEKADAPKNTDKKQSDEAAKAHASGEEKLIAEENEMLASARPEFQEVMRAQLDVVFSALINKTKRDAEFEKKVLLNHKSMKRCMGFCADKSRGLREPTEQEKAAARNDHIPIVTPVGIDMLLSWIEEYYDMDDKDKVEKEEKTAKAKKKPPTKKKSGKKKAYSKNEIPKKPDDVKKEKASGSASPLKKRDKSMSGQMSMFDVFDA